MGYARFIRKFRFALLLGWLLAGAAAVLFLPNLARVVAQQSATMLPPSATSVQAQNLMRKVDPSHADKSSLIVAIVRRGGLSAQDRSFLAQRLRQLSAARRSNGIAFVEGAQDVPKAAASAFTSKDGTTEIAVVGFPQVDTSANTTSAYAKVKAAFAGAPKGLLVYFTGDVPIIQDTVQISQEGVNRTAAVTVALVLVILVLVLRSALAPLLNLVSVGLSFLIASGIDAYLARFGLPVSTFTQTFLIAVMFGAGTDYALIMLGRFREELTHDHEDLTTAIATTMRGVGGTVTFSALTVLLSFATLFLAVFGLYRSAAGVAVGLAVTLAACLTFIPAVMAVFGRSLFWPRPPRVGDGHRPSRIWAATGRLATTHPWWTLLGLAAVLLPVALLFTNLRSFNTLAEIPQAPSVQGFQAVAHSFGEGQVMPLQIVLHSPHDLRSGKGLATVEAISKALAAYPEVAAVQSATRPEGKPIAQFTLASQESQIATELGKLQKGISTLQQGLSGPSGAGGLSQLTTGTGQLAAQTPALSSGIASFGRGAQKLASGASQLSSSAGALAKGATSAAQGASSLATSAGTLASGAQSAAQGAQGVSQGVSSLSASASQLASAAQSLSQALAAWAAQHPGSAQDPSWQSISSAAASLGAGLSKTSQAAASTAQAAGSESQAVQGVAAGTQQLSQGAAGLAQGTQAAAQGAQQLATGAAGFASGAQQLTQAAPALSAGATRWAQAADQLAGGYSAAAGRLQGATRGLASAAAGAQELSSGASQLQGALRTSAAAGESGNPGFGIPTQYLSDSSLQSAMNAYISPDGHVAVFDVQLALNPYSGKAIAAVGPITARAEAALAASPLPGGTLLAAGTSGQQANLAAVSGSDFTHTIALVLLAIFLLLAILLRSIISPLYILASLLATYFVAMGIVQELFVGVLHHGGVEWSVPFFTLLLLVALGVDYSIFLMSRFKEILGKGVPPAEAIREALERMGGVIFSAVVIMAGTFGSMTFSGVTALLENGTAVVIGLLVYAAVLLGLFVPAATAIVGDGLHWPFSARRSTAS